MPSRFRNCALQWAGLFVAGAVEAGRERLPTRAHDRRRARLRTGRSSGGCQQHDATPRRLAEHETGEWIASVAGTRTGCHGRGRGETEQISHDG